MQDQTKGESQNQACMQMGIPIFYILENDQISHCEWGLAGESVECSILLNLLTGVTDCYGEALVESILVV